MGSALTESSMVGTWHVKHSRLKNKQNYSLIVIFASFYIPLVCEAWRQQDMQTVQKGTLAVEYHLYEIWQTH